MLSKNIKPRVWGSHGWKFMHFVALGYPVSPTSEEQTQYKTFFESLQHVLPCETCAHNYTQHLQQLSLDDSLGSQKDLFAWTVNMHNLVNKELGKPQLTVEQALPLYTQIQTPYLDYAFKISIVLILLAILYYLMKR